MMTTSDNKIAVPPGQRPPSPVGMLLWKEWRQQQWLFVGLVAAPIFMMLFGGDSEVPLILILVVVLPATLLLLAANAFCGEEDDGSAAFAEMLPLRKITIFGLKLAMVWALTLTAALVAAGMHTLSVPGRKFLSKIMESSNEAWFYVAAFMLMVSALCAIVSTVARRTITCIGVTLLLGALGYVWIFSVVALVAAMADRLHLLVIFLAAVSAVYFGARLRIRFRGASLCRRVMAVAGALIIICMVTVAPLLGLWVHYVFIKMPEDYLGTHNKRQNSTMHIVPGSHNLLVECHNYKMNSTRIGMIDLDTGKSRWVDRFAHIAFLGRGADSAPYSPDGKRLIVIFCNCWAGPPQLISHIMRELFRFNLFGWLAQDFEPWVVDCDTLRKTRLSDIAQELKPVRLNTVLGWLDNSLLAMMTHNKIMFVDVTTGKVTEQLFPRDLLHLTYARVAPFRDLYRCWTSGNRVIVQSGAYAREENKKKAPWLIYSPGLEKPRRVQIETVNDFYPGWVSPDGQWMFCHPFVASLETGEVIDLSRRGYPLFNYRSSRCREHGFTRDSKHLIFSQKNTVALFNLKTHKALEIALAMPRSWVTVDSCTESPDGRRLLVVGHGGWGPLKAVILDLETGGQAVVWDFDDQYELFCPNWSLPVESRYWLDNERILLKLDGNLVIINADGSGRRYVFPRKEIDPGKVQIAL